MDLFAPRVQLLEDRNIGPWIIVVPLLPQGAGRHKTRVVDLPGGKRYVQNYTPAATRQWKADVAMCAAAKLPTAPLEGPIQVNIWAILPRPKYLLARSKRTGKLLHADEGLMWAPAKPDTDNVEKGVYDSLKSAWRDDRQIVCGVTRKLYAEAAGKPRLVIAIMSPPVMSMGGLALEDGDA